MKDISKFFDMVFDCVPEAILILGPNAKVFYVNQAFLLAVKNLAGRSIAIEDLTDLLPDLLSLKRNELPLRELTLKDSIEKLKVKIDILPEQYFMLKIVSSFAEEDLKFNLHAQRIETLGMLAGGIAHDFNNILTGILGHITYLNTILPQSGGHVVSLAAIEEGARRASSLTQEILNFSRLENNAKPQRIELGDVVERTYHLLRGAISPEFDLEFSLPDEPVFVLANEAKLAQVLVNLAMNSRDAVDVGGFIKIELDTVTDKKELKRVFADRELATEKYARIIVRDNGHGIPPHVLQRIFEPYYSTKNDKGTGLGLAIVNEVVRMFAGAIDVDTEEKRGTSVSVYLPLMIEATKENVKNIKNLKPDLQGGSERILIVDDEYPVRNVLSLSLEHLGYQVEIASSGSEALEIYGRATDPFDLVILDMLMPNMSGDQTFFLLKEIDPNVNVLVISGYSSKEAVNSILKNGGLGFIQKPFTIGDLAKRVRDCFKS